MKIIRDEELGGIMMIPLFVDWKIKRCNVKDCKEKPSTIIAEMGDEIPVFGMCEIHHGECKEKGSMNLSLVFDNFDAFKATTPPASELP